MHDMAFLSAIFMDDETLARLFNFLFFKAQEDWHFDMFPIFVPTKVSELAKKIWLLKHASLKMSNELMNLERHCNYVSILSSRLLGKPTQYYKKTSKALDVS